MARSYAITFSSKYYIASFIQCNKTRINHDFFWRVKNKKKIKKLIACVEYIRETIDKLLKLRVHQT
jgi:hypothetical protein